MAGRPYVELKLTRMKRRKYEIAVAGYPSYRFKTYARDAVEAVVKIKCFLHSPRAECTLLLPKDHVREMESCRMQVRER